MPQPSTEGGGLRRGEGSGDEENQGHDGQNQGDQLVAQDEEQNSQRETNGGGHQSFAGVFCEAW